MASKNCTLARIIQANGERKNRLSSWLAIVTIEFTDFCLCSEADQARRA